jgi:hypothetical protein
MLSKYFITVSALVLSLLVSSPVCAEDYAIFANVYLSDPMLKSLRIARVTADNNNEAIERFKKNFLEQNPGYQIKILKICSRDPQICVEY